MTLNTQKISELTQRSKGAENSLLVITPPPTNNGDNFTVDFTDFRQTMLFADCPLTLAEGISSAKDGETFFVYSDSTKEFVLGYMKSGSGAAALIDVNGNQVKYLTVYGQKKSVAQLESALSAPSGLGKIGSCKSVAELRTIEPTVDGQRIHVLSYKDDWVTGAVTPTGGDDFYYDASDTTSVDDDLFIFISNNGARWKRAVTGKVIRLEWKGIRPGDDATTALNSIGAYLKARAKAAKTIAKLPRVEIGAGDYYISDTVTLSSAFKIKAVGFVTFRTASTWDMTVEKAIFSIENDKDIPIQPTEKIWGTMDPWLNGTDGTIEIFGPGYSAANKCIGLAVGNTLSSVTGIRGACAWGFAIHYCGEGIRLRMKTTYLLTFKNFDIGDNRINLCVPDQVAEDSGERISFSHGGMGAAMDSCVYVAQSPALFFDHISFDFCAKDVFLLEGVSQYGILSISNCHTEVMGGYFIRTTTGSRLRIFITNTNWMPTQFGTKTAENSQSPSRPMILLNGGTVAISGLSTYMGIRPLTHENFLVAPNPDSTAALPLIRVNANGISAGDNGYTPCPVRTAVMNRSWDLSEEDIGATLTNGTTYTTKYLMPAQETGLSGWSSTIKGTVIDLGDGTKAISLVNTGTSGGYAYFQTKVPVPVKAGSQYSSYFSIQKLLATGDINWGVGYNWYDKDMVLIKTINSLGGAFGSVYTNTTLPGYLADATLNGNRKIATLFGSAIAPAGAAFCRPVFHITSFSGTVNIINHVFWELV